MAKKIDPAERVADYFKTAGHAECAMMLRRLTDIMDIRFPALKSEKPKRGRPQGSKSKQPPAAETVAAG